MCLYICKFILRSVAQWGLEGREISLLQLALAHIHMNMYTQMHTHHDSGRRSVIRVQFIDLNLGTLTNAQLEPKKRKEKWGKNGCEIVRSLTNDNNK